MQKILVNRWNQHDGALLSQLLTALIAASFLFFAPVGSAEEIIINFDELPFDPDDIGVSVAWDGTPLPPGDHDFYSDQGLIMNCEFPDEYSIEDCVTVVVWDRDIPDNKFLIWGTHGQPLNNRRMYFKFPSGANDISLEVAHLWEPGKAWVSWLDVSGNVIATNYNSESASEFTISDLQSWTEEEYWENSKHVFSYTRSTPVFGLYIRAWNGNNIPGSGYAFDDAVDNLRFNRLNELPLNSQEELGCESGNLVGNPCNVATGNKYLVETDYESANNGLTFTRSYNSYQSQDIGLGIGWSFKHSRHLEIVDMDNINVRESSGKGEPWFKEAGVWQGESDSELRLVENVYGYTLTEANGDTTQFDLQGKMLLQAESSGNSTRYSYDAAGNLVSVVGPFGHSTTFNYNDAGQIVRMIDPAEQSYDYEYDEKNNLVSVAYPDGTAVTYHYENKGFSNHLTGISDKNGERFATYTYLLNGAVRTTEHADIGNGTQERLAFNYDFSSEEALVTDASGTTNKLFFETSLGVKNMVKQINIADAKETTQTFDLNNNLLSVTDEESRTTSFTYNSFNQMTSLTEAVGTPEERTTVYEYLSSDVDLPTLVARPSVFAGALSETLISYDNDLNVLNVSYNGYESNGNPITRSMSWTYNNRGQVTSADGFRTDVVDITTYTYYECAIGKECGQMASSTNALGHETVFNDYDAHGRLLRSTGSNGLETSYAYDYFGRVISMIQTPPVGQGMQRTSTFTYDDQGQLVSTNMPDGITLQFDYNASHYLTSIVDNVGNRIDYSYDRKGNRTQINESDPDGTLVRAIDLTYDVRNRISSRNSDGSNTQLIFDAVGNLSALTDPNVNPTNIYSYDSLSRLTQSTDSLGNLSSQQHDINDNIALAQSPNSATTRYSYNDFEFLVRETSTDRGTLAYVYDDAGNVVSRTDARGITVHYSYDSLDRLVDADYPGTDEDVLFIYDTCTAGIGQLCQVIDESGVADYTYDVYGNILNQVKAEIGITSVIQYEYDNGNNIVKLTYPDTTEIAFQRDSIRRISAIDCLGCDGNTSIVSDRQYRSDGLILSQTFGNGLVDTRSYDLQGRLILQNLGSVINKNYVYDANGNILQRDSYKYNYDELNRLTSEKISGKANVISYDANGNRLSYSKDDYAYLSGSNVLSSIENDPVTTDSSGHVTHIRDLIITYNSAGRMRIIYNSTTGESTSYTYNAFGQRTRKETTTGTFLYFYDLDGHLISESDIPKSLVSNYVWADDMPVAQHAITKVTTTIGKGRNETSTITYGKELVYLHTDNIHTPRVATDVSGGAIWEWDFDSFGYTAAIGDSDGNGTELLTMLRMPGQYYDSESGLHYNHFRYFDPILGRYLQSDLIGLNGGLNTYGYALQNPLTYIDPHGLDVIVTLYQGQGGNIFNHIGIGATTGNNANQTFGAGPDSGIGMFSPVPGHVGPDGGQPISTLTIPTTAAQDDLLNAYNDAVVNDPNFQYSLFSNSCVDHVRGGLNAAGIPLPTPIIGSGRRRHQSNYAQSTNLPNTIFQSLIPLGTVVNH